MRVHLEGKRSLANEELIVAAVRIVTRYAFPRFDFIDMFLEADNVVTIQAEVVPVADEEVRVFRPMGIVADRALVYAYRPMDKFTGIFFRMALVAQVGFRAFQLKVSVPDILMAGLTIIFWIFVVIPPDVFHLFQNVFIDPAGGAK